MSTTTTAVDIDILKTRLKETWTAGDYDRFSRYMEEGARIFYEQLEIPAGCQLLDVACGSGQVALWAARDGVNVTGVDIAPNLIQRAQARSRARIIKLNKFDAATIENYEKQEAAAATSGGGYLRIACTLCDYFRIADHPARSGWPIRAGQRVAKKVARRVPRLSFRRVYPVYQRLKAPITAQLNKMWVLPDSDQVTHLNLLGFFQPVQCIFLIPQPGKHHCQVKGGTRMLRPE